MKSIVIMDSVSRAAGGLFDAERRLHQELVRTGVETVVLGLEDEFSTLDEADWKPISPRVFPARRPAALGWSPVHHQALLLESGDVLYRAGLWRLPSRSAHRWSQQHRKPEIIAPHGMLDPWAVRNSGWKKRIAGWAYENAHLRSAACLRALCQSEADAIRAFGLQNPIAIIPNGIDLPAAWDNETTGQRDHKTESPVVRGLKSEGRKVLLYLGRLHPKKGLVNLLRAWAALRKSEIVNRKSGEWVLAIAGWDQGGHEAELKRLCDELGIAWRDARTSGTTGLPDNQTTGPKSVVGGQWSVAFLGPQFGDAKAACYASCDAFILPSFSEGLPMVILEAWAYGKPVLMTPECNLPEGFAADAALPIATNPEDIARGLEDLFRASSSALRVLGDNGRSLVAARFTWPKVAVQMKSAYDWVLGEGPRPSCVQTL